MKARGEKRESVDKFFKTTNYWVCSIILSFRFQSGSEKTSARSRLDSSNSITSEQSPVADNSENGGETIDYKALYEAARYVYKPHRCITPMVLECVIHSIRTGFN